MTPEICAVVLAAGEGTRLRVVPANKVSHPLRAGW
ncbi:MAG: hypothetical protein QOE51_413 [Actinoplanes sp.]|jgi:CTP:molybdopterin cytidylyltransferase MocA|nr:hypothetical protein [Actinoplanes sp.]